jgi:hypothetical protein
MKFTKKNFNFTKLKGNDEFTFPKNPDMPPKNGTFFSHLMVGTRGYGKTYSTLQLVDNIIHNYQKIYVISPTLNSDVKQKYKFKSLENSHKVQYYEDFNEDTIDEILFDLKEDIETFKKFYKFKKIMKKYNSQGVDSLTDEELHQLLPYLIDDTDELDIEYILNTFPDYVKKDHPPMSYVFIDDAFGSKLLTNGRSSNFIQFYIKHRHLYASISLLVQSIAHLPRAIRTNSILFTVFPTKSKKDLKILYEETANVFPSENDFKDIMKLVESEDFGFLFIDASNTKEPDIRIGWDKQISF